MSILLDLKKLYVPYSADASLETTIKWFEDQAKAFKIEPDIRDATIAEVFLEMANGKVFSTDSCSCSPDCIFNTRKWSSADMNHYTLAKMIKNKDRISQMRTSILNDNINLLVLQHMQIDNEAFVDNSNMSRLSDWNKSETLKVLDHLINWKKSWVLKWIS